MMCYCAHFRVLDFIAIQFVCVFVYSALCVFIIMLIAVTILIEGHTYIHGNRLSHKDHGSRVCFIWKIVCHTKTMALVFALYGRLSVTQRPWLSCLLYMGDCLSHKDHGSRVCFIWKIVTQRPWLSCLLYMEGCLSHKDHGSRVCFIWK